MANTYARVTARALRSRLCKRLEVVTGPGGVLWGANSFLGIVNVITKDAERRERPGGIGRLRRRPRRQAGRSHAYAMFGKTCCGAAG